MKLGCLKSVLAHWIAVKVPDDSYAMIANGLRIHGVDLDAPDVMHSKGLLDFVKQHKLLEKPDASSFNFAKAFGVIGDVYNVDREWLGQSMLTLRRCRIPASSNTRCS